MLNRDKSYCPNAKPVIVRVPVKSAGKVTYYTKVVMSPCGQCEHCRRKMQNYWSSRLYYEARRWQKLYPCGKIFFCTFTISNEWFEKHFWELFHQLGEDGRIEYNRRHDFDIDIEAIQHTSVAKYIYNRYVKAKFIDILRSVRGVGCKCSYYVAMEFGDQTERIHFHLILYIQDFRPIREYTLKHTKVKRPFWIKGKNCPNGEKRLSTFEERLMESFTDYMWSDFDNKEKTRTPIGHTNVNLACAKSFRYITKYVCKLAKDVEADKMPFHRQSQELGLDIEAVLKAIQDNKPFYLIKTTSKEYKCPISKYYRKKYACLLGLEDEFAMSFIENANRLFVEHAKAIGYDDLNQLCIGRNGEVVDVLHNDLMTVHDVEYRSVMCATKKKVVYKKVDKKTGEIKEHCRYLWCFQPVSARFILNTTTYLNNQPYVYARRISQENQEF